MAEQGRHRAMRRARRPDGEITGLEGEHAQRAAEESIAVEAALEPGSLLTREVQFAPPKPAASTFTPATQSRSVAGPWPGICSTTRAVSSWTESCE